MIFIRTVPDEYYIFSNDRYAIAAVWLLLWQRTT